MLKSMLHQILKTKRVARKLGQNCSIVLSTHSKNMSTEESTSRSRSRSKQDKKDAGRLIWIDLEMTGLDVINDRILEIACLITEGDLTTVAEGPNLVIHHDDSTLDKMGEWCTQHHGESGLTASVKSSKITTEEAEMMVLKFVQQYTPKGKCPLAGNSIGMDKRFIDHYMPKLAEYLHYRVVDVSTVKELCRRWYPTEFKTVPPKKLAHRSMDDIEDSIEELRYYQSVIYK